MFDIYGLQLHSISDAISATVVFYQIFGAYMAIRHYQFDYLIGVILVLKIQQFIKDNTKNIHIKSLKRPRNAKHCNLENNDGDVGNEPGYPSGHMATTSFMTNLYYLKQCKIKTMSNCFLYNIWNLKFMSNYILYNIWNLFMAYARYKKNCHTIFQIIAGYLLGLIVAIALYLLPSC